LRKIALWEAQHPKRVLFYAILLMIPAIIGFFCTGINYDILSYLPDDLESVQGEVILDEVFDTAGISIVITENLSPKQTAALKEKILAVDHVSSVIWVDTIADIGIPASILPDRIQNIFYSDDGSKTMMLVRYEKSDNGEKEELEAIGEIKNILDSKSFISGLSVIVDDTKYLADTEAPLYVSIAVLLAVAMMTVMMSSWLQPIIIVAALGLAVLYNMGTNFFMGEISFITQCVAAVLQMGVTMDYSVFLIDSYAEEKPRFDSREEAMAEAVTQSFTALLGSSLTTVFGFLALCFMRLKLGFDIGFVMAKGVVFGILTVIFILPEILLICEPVMEKYTHRSFVPDFGRLTHFVNSKSRILALLFVVLLVPAYLLQNNVGVYYSMKGALPDYLPSIQGLERLKEDFSMASTQFVIVDDSISAERLMQMERDIEELDGISYILAYNSLVGPAIPDDILPDEVLSLCKQGGYQLIMVNSRYSASTPELTQQLLELDAIVKACDPNAYITGEGAITQELMNTASRDFAVTAVLSIAAIFVLIAICFKSLTIPVILVLTIELAIWLNLSISTIMGTTVSFIDPTVINCIQLGATVDYAILLTTRFREELTMHPRKEAILLAAKASMRSIFQSAMVFFVVTFGVSIVCDINIICGMCVLLSRGAIISGLVILFFLAPVLYVSEGIISKTTPSWRLPNEKQ